MKRTVQMMRAGVPGAANMKEWFHWKWGCLAGTTLKTRNAALRLARLEKHERALQAKLIAKRNLEKLAVADARRLPLYKRILLRVRLAFSKLRDTFNTKG